VRTPCRPGQSLVSPVIVFSLPGGGSWKHRGLPIPASRRRHSQGVPPVIYSSDAGANASATDQREQPELEQLILAGEDRGH